MSARHSPLSERELVLAAQAGDGATVAELYTSFWRAARASAYGVLGEYASAEDAAAESFRLALPALSRLRHTDRFAPWLRRIVKLLPNESRADYWSARCWSVKREGGSAMWRRHSIAAVVITSALVFAFGREGVAQAQKFTTPWGDPDLQGTWNNQTPVPLERPKELKDKARFTPEEVREYEKTHANRLQGFINTVEAVNACPPGGKEADCVESLAVWLDAAKVARNLRTSLIVDPEDGKIPFTADGRKRWLATPFGMMEEGKEPPADRPEDRNLVERCMAFGGLFEPNPFYNNYHYILQTPQYVVIIMEEGHDQRIIPLDGRRHIGSNIRQWLGDSRGRWEGQTLVVETTNYNDRMLFRGATRNLRTVERFTRVAADAIDYEVTFTDPATYAKPWTVQNTLWKSDAMIYESDCHEGNYGLANILSAARAEEKR